MDDVQEDRPVPGQSNDGEHGHTGEHTGAHVGGHSEETAEESLQRGHGPQAGDSGASTSASHMMDIVRRRREAEEKLAQHLFAVEPQLRRTE